ncbi:MAG TPA: Hint domain-containing protein [Anaerolineales bacterium]|nr:Hint domain-containing protein [Anaerolineales bacterium]
MLLFEEDWYQYPTAIVDTTTTGNRSFLDYALLLKAMNIKNWKWPISLIHKELLGIDPHQPSLSTELKLMFAIEFRVNPWAYFRLAARAPNSSIDTPLYFIAKRSNMAVLWLYFNHITTCLVQPRQTGKTFTSTSLDTYLLNIANQGSRTILLTRNESLRWKTVGEIKNLIDLLPSYLKVHSQNDVSNREEISVSALDNHYKAIIARNDPVAADKTGRGHTVDNIRIDEKAYLFFIEIAVRALLPTTTAARQIAELRGNHYGNIFMTTAGKKDDRDGGYAYHYFHNGAPWTEFLFDCKNHEELCSVIKSSSRDGKVLRVHCAFNHRQLGYTDQWLRDTAIENESYGEAYERDYLNIWTSGSQQSPITVEDAKRIRQSEIDIKYAEISKHGQIIIRWYYKEEEITRIMLNDHSVLAIDTSDAVGRDDIAGHFRSLRTGETLGAFALNEINLITVSNFFIDLIIKFPKMTMIPERRSSAITIIDYMHKQMVSMRIDPFRRIFNLCVQEHVEYPERYKEIQKPGNHTNENFLAQYKKFFGFATSASGITARNELYGSTLRQAIKYTGDMVKDKPTIDQILSLVNRNGRVDHPVGGHDDLCFIGSTLVRTIDGHRPISELRVGDLVLTRQGYKPILHIYHSKKFVMSKFNLTGTSNHPFITPNGIVAFKDLDLENIVYVWDDSLSEVKERSILETLTDQGVILEEPVNKKKKTRVSSKGKRELVYNLLIADCHEYFVNDILVHNCVSWLLSYWFMALGRNLQYYGVPSGYVLSHNQIVHSSSNKEELYQADLTRRAKAHIEKLMTAIQSERDTNVVERLLLEVENVKNILGHQHEISLSVDDMINQIKKNKMIKSYAKQSIFR